MSITAADVPQIPLYLAGLGFYRYALLSRAFFKFTAVDT